MNGMTGNRKIELDSGNIARLKEALSGDSKNIVIVTHYNPDGDAIGSSLAWCSVLERLGHTVTCVVPNKFPYFLKWMNGIEKVRVFKEDKTGYIAGRIAEADMVFCLDFNQISRLESLSETIEANTRASRILIDHHLSPPASFDISFSEPDSSSTSFLVYRIIEEMGLDGMISREVAESLYVGIMTDTGNFSFGNLSSQLFAMVAGLVEKGISIPLINSSVYNNFTEGRVRLLGYTINRKMRIMQAGGTNIAYMGLTEREMRRFSFQVGDSEGFVNYPLTIADVRMSAMFLETRNMVRVSLRSKGGIDVNVFARRYFDGGGHKNAAGGKSFRTLGDTVEYFEKCVTEYFGQE